MNSLLGGFGNALFKSPAATQMAAAQQPNILLQALGAAMRGESPQAFMQNLAMQHPQLRQLDLNNLQSTALGYQLDQCCCSIKTQMLQDKYEALETKYLSAQNDLSNAAQSQYILGALGRFVAYPPAAAAI